MNDNWTEARLQQLIDNKIQENANLDYKSSGALGKSDGKKKEITKDVSAMANSAGGIIIYGISEYQEATKKHLPEKIDPVDQEEFPKEWLESIINNIQPRIVGVEIIPISLSSGKSDVVYVVKIPQSTTAHQAQDYRYYKRYNFSSRPMENHEIMDVMGRSKFPIIDLGFSFEERKLSSLPVSKKLIIRAKNIGQKYAKYVNCSIYLPESLATHKGIMFNKGIEEINGIKYFVLSEKNTRRDVMKTGENLETYGTSWFDPILPARYHIWHWRLPKSFDPQTLNTDEKILWKVYADNAPPKEGELLIKEIDWRIYQDSPQNVIKFVAREGKRIFIALLLMIGLLIAWQVWQYFF